MSTSEPAKWRELESLVDALLDAAPEQRAAVIVELSAGDPLRHSELEALLAECEREPSLLSGDAAGHFAALFDDETGFPEELATRYHMTTELGRGGMATVYLARDLKHGRDVAVKVVRGDLTSVLGADRFLREIEIVAQLHHPHIVPLYDSGEAGGRLYYVMPYEAALSLRHRLARDGALAPQEVILILRDVCDALAHAHESGIVHRDIKPDNVLLSGRHAVVTDFGVAKAMAVAKLDERSESDDYTDPATAGPLTETGLIIGTPAYMAPEQISAHPRIDHRVDIYALGVLGYELLAGRTPFGGLTREEILEAHISKVPAPLSTHRQDVPEPLAELIMRSLEKQPADRWQTAGELLQRLETLSTTRAESPPAAGSRQRWILRVAAAAGIVALVAIAVIASRRNSGADASWRNRWSNARIERLTDFAGSEVDAAISANGEQVAFLADRDSVFDAFVSEVGTGRFVNLTGGRLPQLFNEDVRNIGFSPDASNVWIRVADITSPASVSIVPTSGGPPRPFLKTAVTAAWSPDGSRLAYHETTPGDPIYVADSDGGNPRQIFIAAPGVHSHHITWSPDGRFLYFSHGLPPDEMDVWRVPSNGGSAERITEHNSKVAYPVLADDRTLFYTATADDGTGPWLYSMDIEKRIANRMSPGVEHYVSIAASAENAQRPRRFVATVSNPSVQLWSIPIASAVSDEPTATPIALPTARSAAPRFGPDSSITYLASRGGADGIWRLSASGSQATELWNPRDGAVSGAAAVSPDGETMCFPVRRQRRSALHCTTAEGTGVRKIAESLDVRGAPSWSPDGKWIAIAAKQGQGLRVFKIPVDGGAPVRLVDSVSSNPVWSPDGKFILYSGTPRARSVPLKGVTPDGAPVPLPPLVVDRVGDSYRFLSGGRQLVVKLGGFRRQDFWLFDLTTGQRRQLTRLRAGESLHRFDVSPDGKRILFERVRENSDVVLVELPP